MPASLLPSPPERSLAIAQARRELIHGERSRSRGMQGASMSDSEKPAKIDTASDSDFSASRAASMARCIAPVNEALRSVCAISGSRCQRMCGLQRPASMSRSSRPACSPVSYMSTCG